MKLKKSPECISNWTKCKNIKYRDDTDMDGETYDCEVCGEHIYLYYDDMR